MSGGSFNYIYCRDAEKLFDSRSIADLASIEEILLQHNEMDVAKDVRRLIEYIKSARNRVEVLHQQLAPVLKAAEWFEDCDVSEDSMRRAIEKYRTEGKP